MNYEDYVEIDPRYYRPAEVDQLLGDSTKARMVLGWQPKVDFDNLVDMMAKHDVELGRRDYILYVHDNKLAPKW
jgi:GDPmannose 4,6-dehydratase